MKYLSICSGIEAATVAWHPLGWEPAAFSEVDPFPRAVLQHHYPTVPLHGDFTTIGGDEYGSVDILVGGTPCQDFSVAGQVIGGKRAGLAGVRGNLTLEFLHLAGRLRPTWIVWENVPGVLSLDKGRAFGAVLGGLGELGYGFAYRILDAQYFGLAQRRERVFVVGHLGDWRCAAAVLFESASLHGHPAPRREKRKDVAPAIGACLGGRDRDFDCNDELIVSTGAISHPLNAGGGGRLDYETETLVPVHTFDTRQNHAGAHPPSASNLIGSNMQVRRLTPREYERLQGFPDDYTLIPWRMGMAPDGPRYKALGNSMAVPVMFWLGQRIQMVEDLWEAD